MNTGSGCRYCRSGGTLRLGAPSAEAPGNGHCICPPRPPKETARPSSGYRDRLRGRPSPYPVGRRLSRSLI